MLYLNSDTSVITLDYTMYSLVKSVKFNRVVLSQMMIATFDRFIFFFFEW